MIILALDLSLTATGVCVLSHLGGEHFQAIDRRTIRTPARRDGESTSAWNARRFTRFREALSLTLTQVDPDVVVTEVTEHAYQRTRGKKSSKGIEYRAGYGLGRAMGWLDATMTPLSVEYQEISASLVKLRVAGAMAASKDAVKDALQATFHLPTPGWTEAEVDALAVGVGWARQREGDRRLEERVPAALDLPPRRIRRRVTG